MRRIVAVATAAGLLVTMLGAPVGADAPIEESFSVTFPDINPCTESEMEVTINFQISLHEGHKNNFVATVQRTGSVDPGGYTMVSGNETFVANRGGERGHFNDVWRNDAGSAFRAWGVFAFNAQQDELKVDRFRLQCIKP